MMVPGATLRVLSLFYSVLDDWQVVSILFVCSGVVTIKKNNNEKSLLGLQSDYLARLVIG